MLKKVWLWLKAHAVWMAPERDGRTDTKGGGVGFRFWF